MNWPRARFYFFIGVLLASVAGNVWQVVSTHPPRLFRTLGPRPAPGEEPPFDLPGELDLSDEQRATLLEKIEPLSARRIELERELGRRVDDLRAGVLGGKRDPAKLEEAAHDVADLRRRIFEVRLEVFRTFAALLTEEQRAELLDSLEDEAG